MSERRFTRRQALQASAATAVGVAALTQRAQAQSTRSADDAASVVAAPDGSAAWNVEQVGFADLKGLQALKMAIREVRGRWYLCTGLQGSSGWLILDVTNPRKPTVARFVDGPSHTMTLQVDLHGDTMVTALEKIFPVEFDPDPSAPYSEGVLIWDIADPLRPRQLGHYQTGGTGTHRNQYAGGRYAHLAAGMPGYTGNIYVILDIDDRSRPREVGRWWVPGQKHGERPLLRTDADDPAHQHGSCCGAAGDLSLHGPPYTVGNLAYLPYGSAGLIVLDISDVSRPRPIGGLPFSPPFPSRFGVHGVLPVPGRQIAFANSENVTYREGPAHHASIIDISNPTAPYLLSLFPEPVPPQGAQYADFYTRGGWRGPHNMNHNQHNPDVQQQGNLFYLAHFNAGLRVYAVSNKRLPREVGFFLPPVPKKRLGVLPLGELVPQTDDVVVDRRGYIYISHKNDGIYVLRYTGAIPSASRSTS